MKKVILVLALALGLGSVMNTQAQTIEGIGDDKIYHFAAGMLIGGGVQAVVYSETGSRKKAVIYGLMSGLTIGLAKEVVDEINYNGFDSKDLLATVLGSVTIIVPFDLIFKGHQKKTNWEGLRD
mgnify:CR=1 FL=1|tara:strand:+ start:395 stop:766 length:372 start_codon:yes stop_codon:yes gene_type:complete